MDPDLAMALGIVVGAFSVPAILSTMSDGRAPRASALIVLIACGLILYAVKSKAGGYAFADLPDVVLRVAARYLP